MEGHGNEREGTRSINATGLGEWKQCGCCAVFFSGIQDETGGKGMGKERRGVQSGGSDRKRREGETVLLWGLPGMPGAN